MKILSADQVRELDAYTIANEPIASVDLMERAATTFVYWFTERFADVDRNIHIFCGSGNNGGDGLAAARLLNQRFYNVTVHLCRIGSALSPDAETNLRRLAARRDLTVEETKADDAFPLLESGSIIIDALFGSGLNRPVAGYWSELLRHLNKLPVTRVAIDVPSGLYADRHSEGTQFAAHFTFSFQLPKLAFFFAENHPAVGEWTIGDIGLHSWFIEQTKTANFYLDKKMAAPLVRRRGRFDHKGNFGHALLVVGSYGKVGAAILAARACLRSGAGLVTIHAPRCAYEILQIALPEAMVSIDRHKFCLSQIPDLQAYRAVGAGCGLGVGATTREALLELLVESESPLVLDADALNLISQTPGAIDQVPPGSILTPHPREFARLFGEAPNDFARYEKLKAAARQRQLYIVLKGGCTIIAGPNGDCFFNNTGNPGMATAGSGDVLTGILTGLLAQGYSALSACKLGVYLHGLAGDLAAAECDQEALLAGDLIDFLGRAFHQLKTPT